MNSITATLGSLAYDNLVPGDDYKMYHCKKHDNRFGTKYIRPQTREQHSNREYLGAPYKYADDWENSFESGRPADWSPSPELEHGRRVFWGGSPSEDRDSELDYENPLGQWYWQQREKEEREDALLEKRQRAELRAVSKNPGHNCLPVPPPRLPQRPNDQIRGFNLLSLGPFNHNNPMINRHEQGYYWHGVFHRGPIPGALQTPDESDHDEPRQGKKARGRPRNEQKAAVVRNVPRGSPLPSKRELATKTNGRDEAFELSDSEEDLDTTAIAQPIKRKRGRPRKYGANGLILMSPESSTKVQKRRRTVAERMTPETSPPSQEPGRSGGGGKWKPGEAPWNLAALPSPVEMEGVEEVLAIPSSPTEKESEENDSTISSSSMEGCVCKSSTSRDAELRAARDGKRKERRISEEKEDEEMAELPPWNVFAAVALPTRATRSGREFSG